MVNKNTKHREFMNESINVFARSANGLIEPLQFMLHEKMYSIKEVTDYQEDIFQGNMQYYMTVNLFPSGNCDLHFDLKTGRWTLIQGMLPV